MSKRLKKLWGMSLYKVSKNKVLQTCLFSAVSNDGLLQFKEIVKNFFHFIADEESLFSLLFTKRSDEGSIFCLFLSHVSFHFSFLPHLECLLIYFGLIVMGLAVVFAVESLRVSFLFLRFLGLSRFDIECYL